MQDPITFWEGLRWFLEVGAVVLVVGWLISRYEHGKAILDRLEAYPNHYEDER